jgi:hypothetical protein
MAKATEDFTSFRREEATNLYRKLFDIFGSAEMALAELNRAFHSADIRSSRRLLNADGFKKEETSLEFRQAHEFRRLGRIVVLVRLSDNTETDWMIWVSEADLRDRFPTLYSTGEKPRRPLPAADEPKLRDYIKTLGCCGEKKAMQKAEAHFNATITRARYRNARANAGIKGTPGRPRNQN